MPTKQSPMLDQEETLIENQQLRASGDMLRYRLKHQGKIAPASKVSCANDPVEAHELLTAELKELQAMSVEPNQGQPMDASKSILPTASEPKAPVVVGSVGRLRCEQARLEKLLPQLAVDSVSAKVVKAKLTAIQTQLSAK